MKLYDTLTRTTQTVEPQQPPKISVYTCGPTVYDYPHIGNWFTFLRYDTLVRTLKALGYEPEWVMNITDVGHLVSDDDEGEDKLEKGARREGKTAWEIAEFYSDYFVRGMKRLNIAEPSALPKATDHIAEQIDIISRLEEKGFTYAISDGVYFDTSRLSDYGKLAKLDLAGLKEGARVELNPEKRSPTDFALWKFTPKGQKRDMEWESPWGKGFPGWHIECSAMSIKYLGETIDIHGGGIDHIPVHHTNEIAQSESVTGKPFVKYWFHANHITVDGQKISKSLDNGILLEDIENQGYSTAALRLLVLESHYKSQAHFTWESLAAADNRLKSLRAMADLRWQTLSQTGISASDLSKAKEEILNQLAEDLNTPKALAILSALQDRLYDKLIIQSDLPKFIEFLEFLDQLFGLQLTDGQDITDEQKELISHRRKAREAQDWPLSDTLRDQLLNQGIGLRDTPAGQIWFRT